MRAWNPLLRLALVIEWLAAISPYKDVSLGGGSDLSFVHLGHPAAEPEVLVSPGPVRII